MRRCNLDTLRTTERLEASREAATLAVQLQRRLGPERWAEAEAEWALLPDLDSCLPQQRLAWLLKLEAR